jgi:hypothetical protein
VTVFNDGDHDTAAVIAAAVLLPVLGLDVGRRQSVSNDRIIRARASDGGHVYEGRPPISPQRPGAERLGSSLVDGVAGFRPISLHTTLSVNRKILLSDSF